MSASNAQPSPALHVNGLALARGGRRLVSGIDLRLASGDIVFLRGPNGAGKTSLLLALAGVLRPETGTIRIGSDTHVVVRRKGEDYIVESNYGLLCYSFKVCDKDASEDDCHRVFLRWDSKEFELTAKTGRGRVGVSAGRGEGYLVQQGENGGRNPVTDLPAARVLPVGHAIARLVDAQLGPDAAWCGCQSGLFAMPVNPGVAAIPLVGAAAVANRPEGTFRQEDDERPSSPVAPSPQ